MITSSGDSRFLVGEQVEESQLKKVNEELEKEGKIPAIAEPLLLVLQKLPFLQSHLFQLHLLWKRLVC